VASLYRFATFNTALSQSVAGQPAAGRLVQRLATSDDRQVRHIAEIIQRIRPDVILLNEFDYDSEGRALTLFRRHYLEIAQNRQEPLDFPYALAFPANTGISSGIDLNGDGVISVPADALGYGLFPGQYAFALLSRYRLDEASLRSFRRFLWKDMPDALFPDGFYPQQARALLPLSSKNHIDITVDLPAGAVHVLAAHPVPPAFDGPERANARRNFDEIRLLADYITPAGAGYLYDDQGRYGGLPPGERFIIMGDMNADPHDGTSYPYAIRQLLGHTALNRALRMGKTMPRSEGGREFAYLSQAKRNGNPAFITATFNHGLRVDYVLPSAALNVAESGVFWPPRDSELHYLVATDTASSDHRLVWVDIGL
jgi:endonuclease/exonuclease/phosphatase family metal-dependent hydrolase